MPAIGSAKGETAEPESAAAVFTHEAPAIPRTAIADPKTPIHLEPLCCMVFLLALRRNADDRGTRDRARSMPKRNHHDFETNAAAGRGSSVAERTSTRPTRPLCCGSAASLLACRAAFP